MGKGQMLRFSYCYKSCPNLIKVHRTLQALGYISVLVLKKRKTKNQKHRVTGICLSWGRGQEEEEK